MAHILSICTAKAQEISMGNKALSLAELQTHSFNIPKTFVLPADQIINLEDLKDFLAIHFSNKSLAVRSSANKEDLSDASFAGLFETYLDLSRPEDILKAIEECRQSVYTDRVQSYCKSKSIDFNSIQMSVILQEYIAPQYAGVAFSINAISGEDQEMIVEVVEGCGEKLVSGQVTPQRYFLNWNGSSVIKKIESEEKPIHIPLAVITQLRNEIKKIQSIKGTPQDIEFAIQNNQIYFLQSRNITKIQYADSIGEWTTADLRDGGVSSSVVSPMMWSFYQKILQQSMPEFFNELKLISKKEKQQVQICRLIYGRPYWNLGFVRSIMKRVPGFIEKNFDEDLSIEPTYENNGHVTPITFTGILKSIPILLGVSKNLKKQIKINKNVLTQFKSFEDLYLDLDLSKLSAEELLAQFKNLCNEIYPLVEVNYFKTIYNASNAKMELKSILEKYQAKDATLLFSDLASGLVDLKVLGPSDDLIILKSVLLKHPEVYSWLAQEDLSNIELEDIQNTAPDFYTHLNSYLRKYYFHSERELDIRVPRWIENPAFILKTLLQISSEKISSPKKFTNYDKALKKADGIYKSFSFMDKIMHSRKKLHQKLNQFRYYIWMREEMRDHSTRVYYFLRKFILEISKRANLGEDGFLLSHQQMISLLNENITPLKAQELIAKNKTYMNSYSNFQNPNEVGYRYNFPKSPSVTYDLDSSVKTLQGIPCYAGVFKGTCRVLKSLSEAHTMKQGEILVAPFTDPGWTPLFTLASAIITETGGLLSHAALISREFSLPSVLNVSNATSLLKTGDTIIVDGTAGKIHVISEDLISAQVKEEVNSFTSIPSL